MSDLSHCSDVIESFAESCEKLNACARQLCNSGKYQGGYRGVRTSEGIRKNQDGWRLTKWVEACLNSDEGWWAAWELELGFVNAAWLVRSNVSISHSDFYFEFQDKVAASVEELKAALDKAVSELINAASDNQSVKSAIEKHRVG